MPRAGYYTMRVTKHMHQSFRLIAEALGMNIEERGAKSHIIDEALHFYAAKLVTPCCPDCGTDLVPMLDEAGQPTGRWYCPGCTT